MDYQFVLANRIRKARELNGITQTHMAEKLGISQQQYSLLEKGEAKITKDRIAKIAEVLGTTADKIAEFDESKFFGDSNNHIYENHSKEIKEIYESRIRSLETEITRLHALLDKALSK